jgi:hypothetical protein
MAWMSESLDTTITVGTRVKAKPPSKHTPGMVERINDEFGMALVRWNDGHWCWWDLDELIRENG